MGARTQERASPRRLSGALIGGVVAVGFLLALGAAALTGLFGTSTETEQTARDVPAASDTSAPVQARAEAGGVMVEQASVDVGRVPLNTPISHSFKLSNTGAAPVQLGPPRVEILEGCWPPRAAVGATALQPGDQTSLSFTTSMSAGMDGPHLFRFTVPVQDAAGSTAQLQVYFRADFR